MEKLINQDKNADIFDPITLAEERFQENGFVQGKVLGEHRGYEEGFKLGRQHGSRIGAELGFYSGFFTTWKELLEKDAKLKPRKEKAVTSLIDLIEHFPMNDPENPELQEKMQDVRAKFKQVCSLMNINPDYKSAQEAEGMSF